MLTYFIKKAHNRNVWVRPRIIIGVPSEITQVEKRAVKDSAYRAKASEFIWSRKRWPPPSAPACRSPSRPAT
jgi:actin-like ATPase involved in cell morphogenesis